MKKYILTMLLLVCGLPFCCLASERMILVAARIGLNMSATFCDTVVCCNGYSVHAVKKDGMLQHIGLYLFGDELKRVVNDEMLDTMEMILLEKSIGITQRNYGKLRFTDGTITDFKKINPCTPCRVSINNLKEMTVSWSVDGHNVVVSISAKCDDTKLYSRSERENRLVLHIKGEEMQRQPFCSFDKADLEAYGENKYILRGATYNSKYISRNVYFENGERLKPVWSSDFPVESLSNLILFPSEEYGDNMLAVTVVKHDYGKTDKFDVSFSQFMAVCEYDGCVPFWGVEKFENGVLEGSVFLYNQRLGYDHVVHIRCNPADVINNHGRIMARASLFIPTDNVSCLYAPYVSKSEKEKIKYTK